MAPPTRLPDTFQQPAALRFLERMKAGWPLQSVRAKDGDGAGVLPPKHEDHVRLVTLNLAHGRNRGHQALQPRSRLERHLGTVAELLSASDADVVALQEADRPSAWSGNFDHVETLSRLSGISHFYGGHHSHPAWERFRLPMSYGTALLSRYPLDRAESHRFSQSWRDTKGFVVATVRIPHWQDLELDMVSLHLDFLTPRVRRRQVSRLIDTLQKRGHPVVLLGDMNCTWQEPQTLELLSRELRLHAHEPSEHRPTYPAYRPLRRVDWILISEDLAFGDAHLALPHQVSDHLPVVADLVRRG
jgi:endonuclease/exonuclease/phosphatase family metal-dependent hydrolase